MRLTDLQLLGGLGAVDLAVVKLLEDVLEEETGQPFGQLFFSQFSMTPDRPLVEGGFVGLRSAPASSAPRPRDSSPAQN